MNLFSDIKRSDIIATQKLQDLSMMAIPPILSSFPLIGFHPIVDVYAIFHFEPMHSFSLGISNLLKECTITLLGDKERRTSSILNANGSWKSFNQIRIHVLCLLNMFLRDTERASPGYGLRIDFFKGECASRLSGLFGEDGLHGLLEASHYDSVDMVSPFLAAILDACCGNERTAPVTKTYTMYVDVVNLVYRRNRSPGWTDVELADLSREIPYFKMTAKTTFGNYQKSGMGTSKWHAMDHIVRGIREVGGIEYLNGGLFEYTHKLFKENYALTSRRSNSEMEETLRRQSEKELDTCFHHYPQRYQRVGTRMHPCRVKSIKRDGTVMIRSGPKTTLEEIEDVIEDMYRAKHIGSSLNVHSRVMQPFCKNLGEDGISALCRLLKEYFTSLGESLSQARHRKLQVPSYAYIAGYLTPNLQSKVIGSSVYIENTSKRLSQRVGAAHSFYRSKMPRVDTVMIENYDGSDSSGSKTNINSYISVWFAHVLSFFRICKESKDTTSCSSHCRRNCPECAHEPRSELCFVQFYAIMNDEVLPIDGIDKALNCIRLGSHRRPGEEGTCSAAPEFGLVPADSIRGVLHVVRSDTAISSLAIIHRRRSRYDDLSRVEEGWPSHQFYVNRFFKFQVDEYDFFEDESS